MVFIFPVRWSIWADQSDIWWTLIRCWSLSQVRHCTEWAGAAILLHHWWKTGWCSNFQSVCRSIISLLIFYWNVACNVYLLFIIVYPWSLVHLSPSVRNLFVLFSFSCLPLYLMPSRRNIKISRVIRVVVNKEITVQSSRNQRLESL
jgi:hypothetical protein